MANHGLDTDDTVFFYEQEFYCLSNFSAFRLLINDIDFDTLEHAYHWTKFEYASRFPEESLAVQHLILNSRSAHEAFQIAQRYKDKRNPRWDDVKVSIMRSLMISKSEQHEYVTRKLEQTGNRVLIENSWRDSYWGWGENGQGLNMAGTLWMEVRAMRRKAKS